MGDQEYVEGRLAEVLKAERAAGERYRRAVTQATKEYEARQTQLDAEREKIERLRDEPVVIVRVGPGAPSRVFHRTDRQCGWKPSDFERLFLSEALARGLHGCYSCAGFGMSAAPRAS
jgi:hypothetical protein